MALAWSLTESLLGAPGRTAMKVTGMTAVAVIVTVLSVPLTEKPRVALVDPNMPVDWVL